MSCYVRASGRSDGRGTSEALIAIGETPMAINTISKPRYSVAFARAVIAVAIDLTRAESCAPFTSLLT